MKNYNNKKKTQAKQKERERKRAIAPLQRGENSSLQSYVLRA